MRAVALDAVGLLHYRAMGTAGGLAVGHPGGAAGAWGVDSQGGGVHGAGRCDEGDVVRLLLHPLAAFRAGVLAGLLPGAVQEEVQPGRGWLGW